MTDSDNSPAGDSFDAAGTALSAAVPGAPGWFRAPGSAGAVNVRAAGSVQAVQYDDGAWRILAAGELGVGPFDDGQQAADTLDAILALAYNDTAWPTGA